MYEQVKVGRATTDNRQQTELQNDKCCSKHQKEHTSNINASSTKTWCDVITVPAGKQKVSNRLSVPDDEW